MMEKLRKKRLGYWLALGAALIAVIGMIIFAVYQGKGGEGTSMIYVFALIGIVLQIALFFYDGKLGDFLAIGAAVLYVLALGYSLEGGVGNITDAVSNIVLFGIAELAPMNYMIAIVFGISVLLSIVSCFTKREKETA